MSTEVRASSLSGGDARAVQPAGPLGYGPDEVGKLLLLVNGTLVGVPGAYLASGSLAVTALTVVTVCLILVAYLKCGHSAVP